MIRREKWICEYCDKINNIYASDKIIIVEAYMVKKYLLDGKEFFFENQQMIQEYNAMVQKYYQILECNFEGCHVIKMPENVVGDAKHRWGRSPVHFTNDFYDWLAREIEQVIY